MIDSESKRIRQNTSALAASHKHESIDNKPITTPTSMERFIDTIAGLIVNTLEGKEDRGCETLAFHEIIRYYKENAVGNNSIGCCLVSVKNNPNSKYHTDKYAITQALLTDTREAIIVKGSLCFSRILYAGGIDKQFIDFLNGVDTKIFALQKEK